MISGWTAVSDTGGGLHAYACTWILDLFIFELELQQRNLWVLDIKKFEFGLEFGSNGEIGPIPYSLQLLPLNGRLRSGMNKRLERL